jgi:predicted aspartyl protease
MIRGVVNARHEAIVRLRVRGPGGTELDVDAVVDTGFSAPLTLPAATVAALGLARQSGGQAVLADGTVRQFDI